MQEYLIILPDNPSSLDKRLSVRSQHLNAVKPDAEAKRITLGGAMLSEHPKEGEQPNMVGSVMLLSGNSREEVLERIRTDIYTTSGVWDLEKMQVIPFKTATRTGL